MRISYTSVAIDIFHYGHLKLLEQAKKMRIITSVVYTPMNYVLSGMVIWL